MEHFPIRSAVRALALGAALSIPALAAANGQSTASPRQADRSEHTQRDAAVPDETAVSAQPAAPARPAAPLPPPYGPVLRPRTPGAAAPSSAPSETRDETDNPAPAPAPSDTPSQAQQAPSKARTARHHPARRPAWQPPGPMAPRPLDETRAGAPASPVPVPPLVTPTPAVTPRSTIAGPCQGGVCTDASGATMNGASGVGSGGHLCVRSAATVQCF